MQVVLDLQEFAVLPPSRGRRHAPVTTWAFSIMRLSHITPTTVSGQVAAILSET